MRDSSGSPRGLVRSTESSEPTHSPTPLGAGARPSRYQSAAGRVGKGFVVGVGGGVGKGIAAVNGTRTGVV